MTPHVYVEQFIADETPAMVIILDLVQPGVGIRDKVPGIARSWSRKSGTGTGTHNKIRA